MEVDIFKQVLKNYKNNFNMLGDKKFHFASRLFLWSDDKFAKNELLKLKAEYIGINEEEYSEKIRHILDEDSCYENILFKTERKKIFARYPLLKKYNKILFKNLFCENIYGIDLRKVIASCIKKEEFLELRDALWNDKVAVAALSTHAVNYFYTLDYYLNEEESFIDPEYLVDIAEKEAIFKNAKTLILRVYLLTHCIIGESAFYSRRIERNKNAYEKIFSILEGIVGENYENITLDNKVEFLVCAKLCKRKSYLEDKILFDIKNSFDFDRKYFIENGKVKDDDAFRKGEHRNVLALMAFYLEEKLDK